MSTPTSGAVGLRQLLTSAVTTDTGAAFLLMLGLAVALGLVAVLLTYVVRVFLTVVLIAGAPIALMFHALPQTEGIARWWWRTFAACLAIQIVQSLTLVTALNLLLHPGRGFTVFTEPAQDHGPGQALPTMLAVLALLFILYRIPFWLLAASRIGQGRSLVGSLVRGFLVYRTLGLLRGMPAGRARRQPPPRPATPVADRVADRAAGPAADRAAAGPAPAADPAALAAPVRSGPTGGSGGSRRRARPPSRGWRVGWGGPAAGCRTWSPRQPVRRSARCSIRGGPGRQHPPGHAAAPLRASGSVATRRPPGRPIRDPVRGTARPACHRGRPAHHRTAPHITESRDTAIGRPDRDGPGPAGTDAQLVARRTRSTRQHRGYAAASTRPPRRAPRPDPPAPHRHHPPTDRCAARHRHRPRLRPPGGPPRATSRPTDVGDHHRPPETGHGRRHDHTAAHPHATTTDPGAVTRDSARPDLTTTAAPPPAAPAAAPPDSSGDTVMTRPARIPADVNRPDRVLGPFTARQPSCCS